MNQIFNRYPLPKPTKQFTIYQDRQKIKRVDFAYPAWTVIVEADSGRWHSDIRHRQADIDARNKLQATGWIVIIVTWRDVRDRPDHVYCTVRSASNRADTVTMRRERFKADD